MIDHATGIDVLPCKFCKAHPIMDYEKLAAELEDMCVVESGPVWEAAAALRALQEERHALLDNVPILQGYRQQTEARADALAVALQDISKSRFTANADRSYFHKLALEYRATARNALAAYASDQKER